jgi:uncharacterized membrane protein
MSSSAPARAGAVARVTGGGGADGGRARSRSIAGESGGDAAEGRGARIRMVPGLAMTVLAGIGIVASAYLTITKLSGTLPVCGPIAGCETVESSGYSTVFGIPVALSGLGMATTVLVVALTWWRTGDRRALLLSYGLGILGLFVVAYLFYLMVFVIRAVCVWCVTFDTTVVLGWIVSVLTVRRVSDPEG